MNPPFAASESESAFVDYALDQIHPGSLLFAILPNEPVTGNRARGWRQEILKRHTLRASVKMSGDLFQATAHKDTWAIILEAWRPHSANDPVFFGILHDDESASRQSKLFGVDRTRDNVERAATDLARFLHDGRARIDAIPQETCISTADMDLAYDFASETYLDGGPPGMGDGPARRRIVR